MLSFYYLCRTRNNRNEPRRKRIGVVICFHFTIFVVLGTTSTCLHLFRRGCDLLSFYYLCRTRNNIHPPPPHYQSVVICFHFTIFVVLGTTENIRYASTVCCDLLSFYYLCRTRNNHHLSFNLPSQVVICFHFTIFVVLGTTNKK